MVLMQVIMNSPSSLYKYVRSFLKWSATQSSGQNRRKSSL